MNVILLGERGDWRRGGGGGEEKRGERRTHCSDSQRYRLDTLHMPSLDHFVQMLEAGVRWAK